MNINREYKNLSRNIHAPEQLKAKVLESVARNEPEKKTAAGRYSRGWSFVQKAAAAAVLAVVLPVTAFAAVKGLGLLEYLENRGMRDIEAVGELRNDTTEMTVSAFEATVDEQGIVTVRNHYAEYTVLEAVADSETIYLSAKVEPLDDSYFLVPEGIFNASVGCLGIEGLDAVADQPIEEYIESIGKTQVTASVGYWIEESHLDGAEDFRYGEDGTLYIFYSAYNLSGSKDITLKCAGLAVTEGMNLADRVEFEVQLTDKSTSTKTAYSVFDPKTVSDTGIQINSLVVEETEMGLYATFTFTAADAKFTNIVFMLVDASGEELAHLPDVLGSGTIDNGDGTFSRTVNYQKPASMEGLQFIIRDFSGDVNYGPYSFE